MRLNVEYDGEEVRLVSEQPVEMIVPDEESPIDIEAAHAGIFVDALRSVLSHIDDEALRNLDWKPLVGHISFAGSTFC